MSTLAINYLDVKTLRPRAGNPRTHSDKQIKQIARSIEHFGFTNPVLIDETKGVIAGHGRVEAAKVLGLKKVPTVLLSGMSEADIRAYVLADNKIAENAGWDKELLAIEFAYLDDLEIDYDLSLTGFELPEIDIVISSMTDIDEDAPDAADFCPEVSVEPATSRLGDIWIMGDHRLICGDATSDETYRKLLGDLKAQLVFCDPPYNVPINGHVSGLGKIKHREFEMASGEMSKDEFTDFLQTVFRHLATFSEDGSIHYQCMDWRHIGEIHTAGMNAYDELKNVCVWAKSNGGMGSLYRSQHELVFVFKSGRAPHINNVELGRFGRNRTNVWNYAGVNSFSENRDDLVLHPTVKPVQLVADAIYDCSHRHGIVLDAFAGSGSTLVAAQKTGRRGYGIELDPRYVDVIVKRMQQQFDLKAINAASGENFENMTIIRKAEFAELEEPAEKTEA